MTTYIQIKQKCVICGHINMVNILTSLCIYNEKISLDSRVGGNFSAFNQSLKVCEKCHYINFSLNKLIPNLNKNFILSSSYQEMYNIDNCNQYYKNLLLTSILYEETNNYHKAALLYLECAWFCDDYENYNEAKMMRNSCSICLEKYLEKVNRTSLLIILIDVYRRMGKFKKSKCLANKLIKRIKDINKLKIVLFEIYLCSMSDDTNHYINEIEY